MRILTVPLLGVFLGVCWPPLMTAHALTFQVVVTNARGGSVYAVEQINAVNVSTQWVFGSIGGAYDLAPGDINNDGRPDVVTAANQPGGIFWMNNAGGGVSWLTNRIYSGSGRPTAVAVADINGNGSLDAAASLNSTHQLVWFSNNDGQGGSWSTNLIASDFIQPFSIALADISRDGRPDVLASSFSGNQIAWWRNDHGDGSAWSRFTVAANFMGVMKACAADLDGDGDLDVVGVAESANEVRCWENLDGAGTSWTGRLVASSFSMPRSLALADLNGDGRTDIIAGAYGGGGQISCWYNDGTGKAWTRSNIAVFSGVRAVGAHDLDNDGDLDLLAAGYNANQIAWWEQRDGEWIKWTVDSSVAGALGLCAADFSGDGQADIMGTSYTSNRVTLWNNHLIYGLSPWKTLAPPVSTNRVTANRYAVYAVTNSPIAIGTTTQLVCSGWTGSGSIPSGSGASTGSRQIQMNSSIEWLWTTRYLLTVQTSAYGLVSVATGWREAGDVVEMEAVPTAPGYFFLRWDGVPAALGTNNPLSLPMDGAYSVAPVFAMEWRTITVESGPNGTITPSGVVQVAYGGSASFSISPNPGYRIASILINGESAGVSDQITFSNVRRHSTLSAQFERDSIPLRVTSPHGTASPEAGKTTFFDGATTVTCSVADSPYPVGPDTQYVCYGWTGTGDIPPSGTGTVTRPVIMTTYSTISWLWKTQALLRIHPQDGGYTEPTNTWTDLGQEVRVRAIADSGFVFTGWSGDIPSGAELDNPLTVMLDRTRDITARFAVYRPAIHAAFGNHGRIEPAGEITVDYLATPTFQIIPDEGYRVESLLLDGSPVGVPELYQFAPVDRDHTLVASFAPATYNLVVSSPHGDPAPPIGTNTLSAGEIFQCVIPESPVSNGPSILYACSGWTGVGNVPSSGTNLQTDLLILRGDSSISWNWTTQYWIAASAAAGGSVNATSAWRDAGFPVQITATPAAGNAFAGWSGDADSLDTNANPLSFTADRPRELTAHFSPLLYTITASAGPKGSIAPSGAVTVAHGESAAFHITPNDGYRVDTVTVDGLSAGSVTGYEFVNVTTSHTIHAAFVADLYSLTIVCPHGTSAPPAGVHHIPAGAATNALVRFSPLVSAGTQHVCLGWTGTGSVPPLGSTTSTPSFSITNNSSLTWNWRTNYWLGATAGPNGIVSMTGAWFQAGATGILLEARADAGYKFERWSGDAGSLSNANPISLDMTRPKSLRAHFSTNLVLFSTRATGPGSIQPASASVPPGSNASFSVAATPGFRLRKLMVDSNAVPITNYYSLTYDFTNAAQNRLLSAEFGDDTFTLLVSSPHGLVAPTNGLHTYQAGQNLECSLFNTVVLVETGRSRVVFTHWNGSGAITPPSDTTTNFWVAMLHDSSLAWNWKTQHVLSVHISGGGSVNQPAETWLDVNSDVTLLATPDPLNRFVRWTGDLPSASATNNPLDLSMTSARAITAEFAADRMTLYVNSDHGTPSPEIGSHSYPYGSNLTARMTTPSVPSAAIGTQYVCTGWIGSGAAPAAGTSNQTPAFPLTTESSVTWLWRTNYALYATSQPGGTVSASGTWFAAASTARLDATASAGHLFAGWEGDIPAGSEQTRPLLLRMDRSRSVTAAFVTNRPTLAILSAHTPVAPPVGSLDYPYASAIRCSVQTNPLYEGDARHLCSGWTGSGSVPATGSLTSVDVLLTNSSSLTWIWKKQYPLTATGGINGLVSPSQAWHDDGATNASVLATPLAGYQFAGWSGDVGFADTNQNPIKLVMDRPRSIRARFETLRPTLAIANDHGSCNPAPGTYSHHLQGEEIECLVYETPVPAGALTTRFECVGWTGSGSAPASGTNAYIKFTLNENSSLAWNWRTQHWLNVSYDDFGTVSPTGAWHNADALVSLTPTPLHAHRFSHWTGDLPSLTHSSSVPLVVTMNHSRAISAVFVTNRPVLTIVSAFGAADPAVGAHTGDFGRLVEPRVEPGPIAAGDFTQYVQRGWTGSGSVPSNGPHNYIAPAIPLTNDSTLTWNWHPQYILSLTSGPNGTATAAATGWLDDGTNIALAAVPDPAYRFSHWSGTGLPSGLSNRASLMLAITRPYDLTAHFTTSPVTILATFEGVGCGSLSPTGTLSIAPGSNITFSLSLNDHCEGYLIIDGAWHPFTNSYSFTNVIEDHTLHAVFQKQTVNLRVGSSLAAGRFSPPAGLTVLEWGSRVTCSVTNSPVLQDNTRYTCSGWTGSGSVPSNGTAQTVAFDILEDSEILWDWKTGYWLDVIPGPYGSVNQTSAWHDFNAPVTLTAIPSENASFVTWSGDIEGAFPPEPTNQTITIVMDQTRTVLATFRLDQYTLTIQSPIPGVLPPNGIHLYDYGSPVTCIVTASPVLHGLNATQYICAGYTLLPDNTTGPGTQTVVTVTNHLTLVWNWQTNFYLDITPLTNGLITNLTPVSIASSWIPAAASLSLRADPAPCYYFTNWTGDLDGATLNGNQALFFMTRPRQLGATFLPLLTTNGVPYWWMALYGLTNDPENAANADQDNDGYITGEEWVADTNPTNPASALQVRPLLIGPAGIRVRWTASTNRVYALYGGASLMTNRLPIASGIRPTGPIASHLLTNPPPEPLQVFSVEVNFQ